MPIPLEDNFADIVGKAQRGLGLADRVLAERAGVSIEDLHHVKEEQYDATVLRKIAPVLGLNGRALADLPHYHPAPIEVAGLASFSTPYGGSMWVNSYLIWDAEGGEAALFDTGTDCAPMLDVLRSKNLKSCGIFLTHTHGDHIADLARLRSESGASVFVSSREPLRGTFDATGREFTCGRLRIETRLTWGHSRGGITYVVHGLERPVAVVGDAVFAGSMGGGMVSYSDALRTNREEILTLPPQTVLCPGHGPLTTVGEEREHNPFFP